MSPGGSPRSTRSPGSHPRTLRAAYHSDRREMEDHSSRLDSFLRFIRQNDSNHSSDPNKKNSLINE